MRLPNFLSTASNRASLSITQTLYDRRALDCTSSRPLVQSLHELMVLTSTSVRVRETLCQDGGLERLVQIILESQYEADPLAPYKWHLSMQCLLNLSARGSLEMRTRIVEADVIPIVAAVLDNYLVARDERRDPGARRQPAPVVTQPPQPRRATPPSTGAPDNMDDDAEGDGDAAMDVDEVPAPRVTSSASEAGEAPASTRDQQFLALFGQSTRQFGGSRPDIAERDGSAPLPLTLPTLPSHLGASREPLAVAGMPKFRDGRLVPREQDVYWALEIIAFVSKHSVLRRCMQETHFVPQISLRSPEEVQNLESVAEGGPVHYALPDSPGMPDWERRYYAYNFSNTEDVRPDVHTKQFNLFELVEKYTAFRAPKDFPYWACLIMRNFVRKDDGGIRQCANFQCGKWEEFPRQFAKCRRCKRTKYCSKACQLKAWTMHRYWCALSHPPQQAAAAEGHPQAQPQPAPQAVSADSVLSPPQNVGDVPAELAESGPQRQDDESAQAQSANLASRDSNAVLTDN